MILTQEQQISRLIELLEDDLSDFKTKEELSNFGITILTIALECLGEEKLVDAYFEFQDRHL